MLDNETFIKIFLILYSLLFGLAIGSFINAGIYRFKTKKKITGNSMCPNCKHKLGPLDLVPLFSYLFLRGKCRYCKTSISIQYPIVELLTSIIYILVTIHLLEVYTLYSKYSSYIAPVFIYSIWFIVITGILIFIAVYDFKYKIIPNEFVLAGVILTLAFILSVALLKFVYPDSTALETAFSFITQDLLSYVIAAITGFGLLFLVVLATKGKGMGMGDVKFALLMGLILGFPSILLALYIAVVIGAIVGILLIVLKRKKMRSEIPFGPFLVLGTFIMMLCAEQILGFTKMLLGI